LDKNNNFGKFSTKFTHKVPHKGPTDYLTDFFSSLFIFHSAFSHSSDSPHPLSLPHLFSTLLAGLLISAPLDGLRVTGELGFDEASFQVPGRVKKRKRLFLFTEAAGAAFNLRTLELKTKSNRSL
jgi:hypothetical protein